MSRTSCSFEIQTRHKERYMMGSISYFLSMLCAFLLSFTLNKASTNPSFVLTSPSKGPKDMHIECIAESAVSELMLPILMVTVWTHRGRIGRMKLLTVIPPTEIAFLRDFALLKHVSYVLIRQSHAKAGEGKGRDGRSKTKTTKICTSNWT